MLTFFRRIRKELLGGGKGSKYILYALGEIALVFIGILLALQVNNWNEWRKDRLEEHAILLGLSNEFSVNKSLVAERYERLEKAIANNAQFENLLARAEYTADDMKSYVDNCFHGNNGGETTNLSFGVIDALLSTDDINLIRNDSLKFQLTFWRDLAIDFMENERLHLDFSLNKFHELMRNAVLISVYDDISQETVDASYLALAKSTTFRNYVHAHYVYLLLHIRPKCKETMKTLEQIQRQIDVEIQRFE